MAIELASKIFGSGLQTPRKAGEKDCKLLEKLELACRFRRSLFMATSPLLWYMGGAGEKKEKDFVGGQQPIQPHPHLGSNSLRAKPKWKDIPLSNFDLLKWVDFLKIKNFKGIFSRDSKDHLHKTGSCIINLDDKIGNGTHWVATDIKGKNVFILTLFPCLRRLSLFHMQKELENRSSSTRGIQFKNCNLSDAVIIVFIS